MPGTFSLDSTKKKKISKIVIRSISNGQPQTSKVFSSLFFFNYVTTSSFFPTKPPCLLYMNRTLFWWLQNLCSPNYNSETPNKGLCSFSVSHPSSGELSKEERCNICWIENSFSKFIPLVSFFLIFCQTHYLRFLSQHLSNGSKSGLGLLRGFLPVL